MVNTAEITRIFQLFRNIDPRMFDRLVDLVEARVMEVTVAVTEAPPDQILVAQGRAQDARKWLQLMTEFPPPQNAAGPQAQSQTGVVPPAPRGP